MHGRRRSGTEAVLGQEPGDGGLAERGLEPSHGSAASRAGVEVGTKDVSEQPRPPFARRGAGVVLVGVVATERGKRELVAGRGRRSALGRIARSSRSRSHNERFCQLTEMLSERLASHAPSRGQELRKPTAIGAQHHDPLSSSFAPRSRLLFLPPRERLVFWLRFPLAPPKITLCPGSCGPLQATPGSQLDVLLGCKTEPRVQ